MCQTDLLTHHNFATQCSTQGFVMLNSRHHILLLYSKVCLNSSQQREVGKLKLADCFGSVRGQNLCLKLIVKVLLNNRLK